MRILLVGLVALSLHCSPAQKAVIDSEVPADVLTDVQCVSSELLEGALTDPLAILAKCGSLAVGQLITLAENLLAVPTAMAALPGRTPHYPTIVLSDAQRARILAIKTSAVALSVK